MSRKDVMAKWLATGYQNVCQCVVCGKMGVYAAEIVGCGHLAWGCIYCKENWLYMYTPVTGKKEIRILKPEGQA